MAECGVCFRHCRIEEGSYGFCGARACRDGRVVADNYGRVTSLALDPIEKKPLNRFYTGSMILSVGSYGCNLRCPFCQNHEISWSEQAFAFRDFAREVTPEELVDTALGLRDRGNIGLAYTYNEPLVGYEFVRDCAVLAREAGLKNVMVTNGTASLPVLDELLPYIDAMNIDLKGFSDRLYGDVLSGSRRMVMDFIERASMECHVELTTLIVPGLNDTDEEMEQISAYIAGLRQGDGREIPLHISRFFPRFQMTDRPATDPKRIFDLARIAQKRLKYVYPGNV